jgi:hypothetical protein
MAGDEPSGGAGLFEVRERVFGAWARVRVHSPEHCILPFAANFPCAPMVARATSWASFKRDWPAVWRAWADRGAGSTLTVFARRRAGRNGTRYNCDFKIDMAGGTARMLGAAALVHL